MPTIYRFPILYRLAMRVGYGTDYGPRHALVAPAGAAIMQASLYQFHDIADALLPRLWEAARRLLVIAEPVRNVSRSRVRAARWIARILTRTDGRVHTFRYTAATLLDLYRRCRRVLRQGSLTLSRITMVDGGSASRSTV